MTKTSRPMVPVTMRALLQRINRKLATDDEQVRKTRGDRWLAELGDYYVVNFFHNAIVDKHVDPETMGRELGVLAAWERVADPTT